MISYEEFKKMNAAFGGFSWNRDDETMCKNYIIACKVEREYNHGYHWKNRNEPQPCDVVEFATDTQIFKHAIVVGDNHFHMSKYGVLTICENGSPWTDGKVFSTSGGAFTHFHKSRLVPAGMETCVVWTWGCNGSGASQRIYFPLTVRKWIIPYEQPTRRTRVTINREKGRGFAVIVESYLRYANNQYCAHYFDSVKAFKAWADYVGFVSRPERGTFRRVSSQQLCKKYITSRDDAPKGGKPIKQLFNARIVEAWVVNDGNTITTYVLNESRPPASLSNEELEEYEKYSHNPLGV